MATRKCSTVALGGQIYRPWKLSSASGENKSAGTSMRTSLGLLMRTYVHTAEQNSWTIVGNFDLGNYYYNK